MSLYWGESPGAADAQFWVLLARVILSHTGPLINGTFVGASLRSGLRCWDSDGHMGGKQQWYGLDLWLEAYVTKTRRGDEEMDRAFGVEGQLKGEWQWGWCWCIAGGWFREGGRNAEEKEESKSLKDADGGAPWSWGCFCFSGKHWWNVAPNVLSVNFQRATKKGGSEPHSWWEEGMQGGERKFSGAVLTNRIWHHVDSERRRKSHYITKTIPFNSTQFKQLY